MEQISSIFILIDGTMVGKQTGQPLRNRDEQGGNMEEEGEHERTFFEDSASNSSS
jgi:hypothetical protein